MINKIKRFEGTSACVPVPGGKIFELTLVETKLKNKTKVDIINFIFINFPLVQFPFLLQLCYKSHQAIDHIHRLKYKVAH